MSYFEIGKHDAPAEVIEAFRAKGVEIVASWRLDHITPSFGVMVLNGDDRRCAATIPAAPTEKDIAAAAGVLRDWISADREMLRVATTTTR